MAVVTHRQRELLALMRAGKRPQEIATRMGVSLSRVTQLRTQLLHLGVIRRRTDVPAHGRYTTGTYPWIIGDPVNGDPVNGDKK